MKFWSIFWPFLKVSPNLCTQFMMMAMYLGAFISCTHRCMEVAWHQSVAHVRENLDHVVQECTRWADRLDSFNHCPHFPFFMVHFMDSMPISSIGG